MNSRKMLVKFGKLEQFNSSFSKCNVAIAYHGDNRNFTSISKDVFESMIPSIYGIPIVGEWKEHSSDFGDHGGKIEITDDDVKYIDTTTPIGFIDSQAKVWWEDITEDDGTVNNYLFAECVLWTGRYEHVKTILNNNSSQSMEIAVNSGEMRDDGYYEIKSGQFDALCVLGEDVEPCFESSSFRQFNVNKDKFQMEFSLMLQELKQSVKGGDNMEDLNKDIVLEDDINTEDGLECEVIEILEDPVAEEVNAEGQNQDEIMVKDKATDTEDDKDNKESDLKDDSHDFDELTIKCKDLEDELTNLKCELLELRKFKDNALREQKSEQVNAIFEKYSTILDVSEIEDIKTSAMDMELDELERELSYRLVQKKFDFSKITKKDSTKINIVDDKKDNDPYGSASIYFNK